MTRRLCDENSYPTPLLAVAGFGLPGASRAFPVDPLCEESWTEIQRAAHAHRVTGLLRAAVDAGALPTTEAQRHRARTAHLAVTARVLALEGELLSLVDLLTGAGVEIRVLKGTAAAHLDYAQPAVRSFVDVDVLVRPVDFDHVVHVLVENGFVRPLAEPRPGFDRRFDKGTTLVSPAGYELDLHRTFVLGPWGVLVDIEALWDGGQELVVGGRTVRALSRPNRFLHACYHAALGDWPLRLGSLRDVAEMLRGADHDGPALLRRASDWGVEAVVAAAVADSRRLLGLTGTCELSAWAERYVPSRREEARLGLYTHADKTFSAQALATLVVLPRLRDRLAYLRALTLPDGQYVGDRHPSAWARFRFALREARRGRGPRT